jgi:hypothetical protein
MFLNCAESLRGVRSPPVAVARGVFAANDALTLGAGAPLTIVAIRYTDVAHGGENLQAWSAPTRIGDAVGAG